MLLLRPFGFDTLPVWVYNLASESRFHQAALPALSIMFVALIPVYLLSRQLDRPLNSALIVSRGRAKRFGDVAAVDDVSFELGADELLALVGPSGCGKSTLLRMVAGLHRPDTGSIHLDGVIVDDGRGRLPPERRRIGLVFQEHALFPHLTVAKNIAFGVGKGAAADARRRRDARAGRPRRASVTGTRTSCPVASANVSRWPGRWHRHPPDAARRAVRQPRPEPARQGAQRRRVASCGRPERRRCSSPTTRPRRWRSATASP